MNNLEKALFLTDSIKIAPYDKPFWYTSGTIGPYFINTHFLYGGEDEANKLLAFINNEKDDPKYLLPTLYKSIIEFYNSNKLFKEVIDVFYKLISIEKDFNDSEYVSGGERRDWFFSPIIAHLANKKHLFIYKDLNVYYEGEKISNLNNAKVSHICDLVTKASSFERAWILSIKNINGNINFVASIVDRDEGGFEYFKNKNIKYNAAVIINENFLNKIKSENIINENQLNIIKLFKEAPDIFGKNFILDNPDFIKQSLKDRNGKAQRCIDENPYNLNFKNIL